VVAPQGSHVRPWSTTGLLARDVRDPLSLGSVHVTGESDLRAVGPWSRATLYAVVEEAAPLDRVVVLDYGREHLYVAADATRRTDGPALLTEPRLAVDDPLVAVIEGRRGDRDVPATRNARNARNTADGDSPPSVSLRQFRPAIEVTPPFDVLVPAFDLPADREPPPPTDPGPTRQPTGRGTGTPM